MGLRFHLARVLRQALGPVLRAPVSLLNAQLPQIRPSDLTFVPSDDGRQTNVLRRGKRIAWARIAWQGPRNHCAARYLPAVPEIHNVEVRWRYRSRGVGTQLLAQLHGQLTKAGCQRCCLGVWHNNTRAARLYESLGYQRVNDANYTDEYTGAGNVLMREPAALFVKRLA